MTQIAADTFIRSNQSGWGTASDGNTWATNIGSPTLSIASNEGHATGITAQSLLELGSTTSSDAEVIVRCQCSATTSTRMGCALRISTNNGYIARLSASANNFVIGKIVSGTETDLFTASFTVSTATFYWVRFRAVGTNLYAKAWSSGSVEPTSWTVSGTDSSITSAGGVGVTINASSSATTWDFDSFYGVDYALEDNLTVIDSSSVTVVAVPSDSLTVTETLSGTVLQNNVTYVQTAYDSFTRSNQTGWGTATDGTTWTVQTGSLTYAISSNTGTATGTTGDAFLTLDAESSTVEEYTLNFQFSNTNNVKAGILARYTDSNNLYWCFVDFNAQNMHIAKSVTGIFTSLTNTSITISASTNYILKFRLIGSNLFSKFYASSSTEPSSWTVTTTDSSLSTAAKTGIFVNATNSGTVTINNFLVDSFPNGDFLTLTDTSNTNPITLNTDTLTTSDSIAETITFLPVDQLTETEVLLATLSESITDTALTVTDVSTATVIALNTDALTIAESISNTITALLTEVSTLTDTTSNTIGYSSTDSLVSSDSLTFLSFVLVTLIDVALSITETVSYGLTFLPVDQLTTTEVLLATVSESITDIALTVTDISTTTGIALNTNTLTVSDSIAETILFTSTDQLTVIEALLATLSETFTDIALTFSDISTFTVIALNIEQLSSSDFLQFSLASYLNFIDTPLSITETASYLLFVTDVTDTVPVEILLATVSTTNIDILTTSDSIQQSFQWILSDSSTVSDAIAATISVSQTDSMTILDTLLNTLLETFTDTLTSIDLSATMVNFGPTETLGVSEINTLSLSFTTTELLSQSEIWAISLLNASVPDSLTATEFISLVLSSTTSNQVGINEIFSALLQITDSYTLTAQETMNDVISFIPTDYLILSETIVSALSIALSDQNTVNDLLNTAEILQITDTLTAQEILISELITSFTGWTDINTIIDSSTVTVIAISSDISQFTEQITYGVQFSPVDTNTTQGVLSASFALSLVDVSSLQDTLTVIETIFSTDALSFTENPVIAIFIQNTTDMLLETSSLISTIIYIPSEITTITELYSISFVSVYIDIPLSITDQYTTSVVFVPVDSLLVTEQVSYALNESLIDTALTVLETGPVLTLGLLDVSLVASDILTYTNTVYMLSYMTVRSGSVNMHINIGEQLTI